MFEVQSCETKRLYCSGGGTIYDPTRHDLIECPWLDCARRCCHKPTLMLYRHRLNGAFMLGVWIAKPNNGEGPGYFMDLEDLKGHPDNGYPLGMAMVRARLQPVDEMHKAQEKTMARQFYEEGVALDDSERQRKEAASWMLRKYGHKMERAAWGVARGEGGYAGSTEGKLAETVEMFGVH